MHVGQKSHLLRESLRSLATRLDPNRFLRIHRSAIVNVSYVRELRKAEGTEGVAVFEDGTALRVGRGRRSVLEAVLERAPTPNGNGSPHDNTRRIQRVVLSLARCSE